MTKFKTTMIAALAAAAALAAPMSASALCYSKVTFQNNTGNKIKILRMYTSKNGTSGWRTKLNFKTFELMPGASHTKKYHFGRKPKKDFTVRVVADNDINRYYVYEGVARARCKHGHHVRFDRVLVRGD